MQCCVAGSGNNYIGNIGPWYLWMVNGWSSLQFFLEPEPRFWLWLFLFWSRSQAFWLLIFFYLGARFKFHCLKASLASYTTSTLFLTFRWVWGFWKWSQMISHGPKHGVRHQNQVSSMFRSKVIISLLEVVLGLLHPLHLVIDLQVGLRLLKMVPNDFSWPRKWC